MEAQWRRHGIPDAEARGLICVAGETGGEKMTLGFWSEREDDWFPYSLAFGRGLS